jgi:glyoxylase-like metal-dependent hydrolase (beta-lactamase superfamily II)
MMNEPIKNKRLPEMNSTWHVLQVGSGSPGVRSSVSLIVDGDQLIVVDPGMAPSQSAISGPLRDLGFGAGHITDVVISHHHPDHTINVGMFPNARVHDHWAVYHYEKWDSRPAEGFFVSPSVLLWETPGHTPQDITTVAGTDRGLVAFTHLWFRSTGPADDPYCTDPAGIHRGRARVLEVAGLIVPGHGAVFTPDVTTPR